MVQDECICNIPKTIYSQTCIQQSLLGQSNNTAQDKWSFFKRSVDVCCVHVGCTPIQ